MDDDFGLDDEAGPRLPFHPADVLVSLAIFAEGLFGVVGNLFRNLRTDAQGYAETNRSRRAMRVQTLADIRALP